MVNQYIFPYFILSVVLNKTKHEYWYAFALFINKHTANGILYYLGQIISIEAIRLFEGDMVFSAAQREAAEQGRVINFAVGRATSKYYLWPSGIVPFSIEKQLSKYSH